MPLCLIIVASICLPWIDSKAEIISNSIAREVELSSAHGEVAILHSSDNIQVPDWSSVTKTCGDGGCIEYARADQSDAKGVETHFVIRRPNCGLGQDVYVRAATAAGRDRLLDALSAIPPNGTPAQAISLSRLSTLSWFRPMSRDERLRAAEERQSCTDG
jgi:hypothetical protein